MTLERQFEASETKGLHALLLAAYLTAMTVGLASATFAPWFKLGFLLIGATAAFGARMVILCHRRFAAAEHENVHGRSRALGDQMWVLLLPLAAIIVCATWKILAVVSDLALG